MSGLSVMTVEQGRPARRRWGRALAGATLAVVVGAGSAFTGLTPAHADASVSTTIAVGGRPVAVAFSPDGTQAYVTNLTARFGGGEVSVIAVATGKVSKTITVGGSPEGVSFSPDGTQAYVTNQDNRSVSVIAVATGKVSRTIAVGGQPGAVAFSPDGTQAYATNYGFVSVIAVATGTVSKTITVGGGTQGVAFSPDGTQAYVTRSSGVSVIAVATGTVSNTIAVGQWPLGVAFSPDGTQAYVTDIGSGSVSVIATGLAPRLVSMKVSPSSASVQAGTAVTLTAEGYSSTAQNKKTDRGPLSPAYTTDSNGVTAGSTITFTKAGSHLITASLRGVTATTTVTVTPAALASITISPTSSTVKNGDTLAFTTTGFDRFGNTHGPVTGASVFGSDNRTDTVQRNTVQFGIIPGKRTITGAEGGFTATGVVTVQVGPLALPS